MRVRTGELNGKDTSEYIELYMRIKFLIESFHKRLCCSFARDAIRSDVFRARVAGFALITGEAFSRLAAHKLAVDMVNACDIGRRCGVADLCVEFIFLEFGCLCF